MCYRIFVFKKKSINTSTNISFIHSILLQYTQIHTQHITDNTRIFLHFFLCHFHFDLQIVFLFFVVVVGINIFGAVQSKNIKQQFCRFVGNVMYSIGTFYDGNIFLCCGVNYFCVAVYFCVELFGWGDCLVDKGESNFGFYFS